MLIGKARTRSATYTSYLYVYTRERAKNVQMPTMWLITALASAIVSGGGARRGPHAGRRRR
jgi:hypothetical protein